MGKERLEWVVRPAVTLLFSLAICYGFVAGLVSPDAFLGVAGIAIGFYFQRREAEKSPPPTSPAGGGTS